MFANQRHEYICDLLRHQRRIEVVEAAKLLDVTPETIRKDLDLLEKEGLLRRVHGGAILLENLRSEINIDSRLQLANEEKIAIASKAVTLLRDGDSIIIDSGSTTNLFSQCIPEGLELMVVTNSPHIALNLSIRPELTVLLIGGRLRSKTASTVDAWAIDALRDIRVSIAFMGANGISVERGATTPDPSEAAVKRGMVLAAKEVVILADSTKYGDEKFARFANIGEISKLVTDSALSNGAIVSLEGAGVEVIKG